MSKPLCSLCCPCEGMQNYRAGMSNQELLIDPDRVLIEQVGYTTYHYYYYYDYRRDRAVEVVGQGQWVTDIGAV